MKSPTPAIASLRLRIAARRATETLLAALALLFATTLPARAATYYVDFASGSNSNSGTSKASPWKSAPGMQTSAGCGGATHAYTASPGDQIIFKGGVTWPAACFEFLFAYSGSSAAQIYIGVDQTWFTGASWTRPIWDGQLTAPTGGEKMFEVPSANGYVTLDNIEVVHYLAANTNANCEQAAISGRSNGAGPYATNFIVENVYDHDWGFLGAAMLPAPNTGLSSDHNLGSICSATLALNDFVDDVNGQIVGSGGHDKNGNPVSAGTHFEMGSCFKNVLEVSGGKCHDVGDGDAGYIGPGGIHGAEFYNLNQQQFTYTTTHSNVIEDLGTPSPNAPIYDNAIHDNSVPEVMSVCYNDPVYNNVAWNNGAAGSIINPTNPNGSGCSATPSTAVGYVVNNTIECAINSSCINIAAAFGTFNFYNNQIITNQANGPAITYDGCSFGCPTTINQGNNPITSTASAAAQGYTAAGKYAPTSGTAGTVGAGVNKTTYCAGQLLALCSDASGTAWYGGSYKARPTGTAAWDLGAYEFQGGAGGGPPTVSVTAPSNGATVSGSVSLTASCAPQGSATVGSIQFAIDGINFGAPGASSPYTFTWNTLTAANAGHTVSATCTDSNSQTATSSPISVTVSNSMPGCFVSGSNTNWNTYQSFTAQTTNFTATFTATPNTNNQDSVIALSQAPMSAYSQGAALVRFNSSGQIDVYKGSLGDYTADTTVSYSAGTTYAFTFTVNMTAGTYTVALTSPTSVTLATGYTFRTTASATSLGYINAVSDNTTPDTAQVCAFQIGGAASLTFSPLSLDFGNITVGANSTQTITATTSGGSVNFSSVGISGNADFTINSNTCSGSVPSSCTTQIKFAPTSAAFETATVTFTNDATGSPQTVAVSGTGVPATPTLSVSPTSLNFGSVHVHATSSSGPIVLSISSGPVTFTGTPSLSGADAADFALASNTCAGTVSAPSCQTVVSFTPSAVGSESATLSYTDDATGSPQSVALTGTGYLAPHPPTAVHATVQ